MEEHETLIAEEEYETLITDTAENCAEIFKWKKAGRVEIYDAPRWLLSSHFGLHFGQKYRRKNPAQPKVKKLVDRTAEEIIPLIGHLARKKRDGLYFMITSNQVLYQENIEIAPFGSEDWRPMQKEIEVEG